MMNCCSCFCAFIAKNNLYNTLKVDFRDFPYIFGILIIYKIPTHDFFCCLLVLEHDYLCFVSQR